MSDEEITINEIGPVEKLDKDKEMINLLEQRKAIIDIISKAEKEKEKISGDIENKAGKGTHYYGKWKVSVTDYNKNTFNTASFKKDHPDMVDRYMSTSTVHQVRIEEKKTN